MPNAALDKQAIDDTCTIEDVKQFIADARKRREDFVLIADRSWNEIEKRNKRGQLYGGTNLERPRRWTKFPLWWSCWKIRQPITLARLPLPVLKDTQGDDPYGRTACVIGERLTRGILKTFEAYPEFSSANDDFLITNFGWGRWFYRCKPSIEQEKVRLQEVEPPPAEPQMGPDGQPMPPQEMPPIYVTPDGEQIPDPQFDDMGPYILTGQDITVDNEEVYFEAGLYRNLYVDPDARRWSQVTRLAVEYEYSYRDFVEKFGKKALDKLASKDLDEHRTGRPILVYEYQDKMLREVRWCAENSADFFQPLAMSDGPDTAELEPVQPKKRKGKKSVEDVLEEPLDHSDLYGLEGFFPLVEPLLFNASTTHYWPTPEFFQVQDILDDIHGIVGRMFLLTKAIRIRFFFDSSVTQLKSLISETGEGGGLGIPDLERSLMNNKGSLSNLVAYFPVDEMVQGLNNIYKAFEQRLDMFYQVTGLSDLIRGQTNPDSDKTFGERQMEGKFALNRIEPLQRLLQEWIKNNYQLGMELALKMFSDETIDEYVTPQTLDEEDRYRYIESLELLKNNRRRRFRVDFETDSTIAVNEQWKRKQAIETANTITKMMEGIATVAETQPELAATELKIAQHVVGELSDGKLFADEIQDSIEQVIERVKQPKAPEFDAAAAKAQMDGQKMQLDDQFRRLQLDTQTQIEIAKMQQKNRQDSFAQQLEQIKLGLEQNQDQATIQLAITKLQSDIALAQQDLQLKREAMMATAQAEGGKQSLEAFRAQIDARVASQEMTLAEAQQQLEAYRVQLEAEDKRASLDERIATEQRLQADFAMSKEAHIADTIAKLADVAAPKQETPKAPPVTIDMSKTISIKPPAEKSEKKPKKDKKR
jgi:hypothetical protein